MSIKIANWTSINSSSFRSQYFILFPALTETNYMPMRLPCYPGVCVPSFNSWTYWYCYEDCYKPFAIGLIPWAEIAQLVQRLAKGWTVRVSNPGGGEIFRTRPDRTWDPPNLLYNGYSVFAGGKTAGAWRWPLTPSSAEVKERVGLYLYSSSGSSWPVNFYWAHPKVFFSFLHSVIRGLEL